MSHGNWSAALYLDSRASAQQGDALTKIFTGQAGGVPAAIHPLISKVLGIRSAEIAYHAAGRTRRMTIQNVGESEIEALQGAGGADVMISNHPLAIAPGHPSVVSRSKQLKFNDTVSRSILRAKPGSFPPLPMKAE